MVCYNNNKDVDVLQLAQFTDLTPNEPAQTPVMQKSDMCLDATHCAGNFHWMFVLQECGAAQGNSPKAFKKFHFRFPQQLYLWRFLWISNESNFLVSSVSILRVPIPGRRNIWKAFFFPCENIIARIFWLCCCVSFVLLETTAYSISALEGNTAHAELKRTPEVI